jgi:hypothetical protein
MKVVPNKCSTHPKYQAKRAPRAACEDCWRIWIATKDANPELQSPVEQLEHKQRRLQNELDVAGDRRDWSECNRLERELDGLRRMTRFKH